MKRAFSGCVKRSRARQFLTSPLACILKAVIGHGYAAFAMLLLACGSPPPVSPELAPGAESACPPDYVLVFVIHGDGSYLYHDSEGGRHEADEEALAGAKRVAERNPGAEVFIFHQKHRRHFLLFFPRHDGEFYYYRNGQLLAQESYWRDQGQSRFDPEVTLYNQFGVETQPQPMRLFFYFGHEIPEVGGRHYDASYGNSTFTVRDLVDGLKRITPDSTRFDLAVLSTCFNGTPHTVSALSPYARYVIASPGNLHLSYFDLRPFESLEVGLRNRDVFAFAKECARQSFDRLANDMQTEITVAVYDVDRVQEFANSVDGAYNRALATLGEKASTTIEHCDCADDDAYAQPTMSEGVDILYRPARFGRSAQKQIHSGWECPKLPQ